MGKLRITGLTRLVNQLRSELASPLTLQRRQQLQNHVAATLRQVDEILQRHGRSLKDLPAPSRRAYQFLAGLDFQKIATTAAAAQPTPPALTQYSWPGLSRYFDALLDRLAGNPGPADLDALHRSIRSRSRLMESSIDRQHMTPEHLSPASRAIRGWLAYFTERENLDLYIRAVQAARPILEAAANASGRFHAPVLVHFRPMSGLSVARQQGRGTCHSLPTGMIGFDAEGFADVAAMAYRRDRHARQRILDRMVTDPFQAIQAEIESLAGIVEKTRGMAHDLSSSFERVNARYFAGQLSRPRLTWSRILTGRKFGHYDWLRDTVLLSSTLDQPSVPQYAVDFVLYHELLHKKHGVRWIGARGYAHTPEFVLEERQFEKYEQAESVLQHLARGRTPPVEP